MSPACSSSFSNLPQRNHASDSDNILEIVELERFSLPKNWSYSAFKNVGPSTSIWSFLRFLERNFRPKNRFFKIVFGLVFEKKIQDNRNEYRRRNGVEWTRRTTPVCCESGEFESVDGGKCEKPSIFFKKKRIFRRGYTVNNQAV